MRLEEYDTKYSLEYMPGDIQSMRKAMSDYTRLIGSGDAFEDSYCVAHFMHQCESVSMDYFKEHQELIDYLEGSSPFFNINSDREDIQSSTTGEALFFLCAAMHPELEKDMKEACEAMVAFSRRLNDSSDMWLTCESPFGIEPLQITAAKYPKYGYLLAGFLIPYWDDEHMPEALYSLGNWSNKLGITEDTLKAFCYCDNSRARENMLGYDTWDGGYDEAIEGSGFDLLSHFRSKPEEYEKFKDMLVERYKEVPYLQYCDDNRYYEMNPIKSLIMEMLYLHHPYETWRDDHDVDNWLTNRFIDSQADEAIVELKKYVEEKLERSITSLEEIRSQFAEREAFHVVLSHPSKNQEKLSETERAERLFLEVLPNGEELWKYVIEGTNKECLNGISPLTPIEKQEFFKIITKGEEFSLEYLEREIDDLIDSDVYFLIDDFIVERTENYSMKTSPLYNDNEALRLYDVLHLVMGKPTLHKKIIKTLRRTFSRSARDKAEEVIKGRYPITWEKSALEIVESIKEMDYPGRKQLFDQLQKLYGLIEENRYKAKNLVKEWFNKAPEEAGDASGYVGRSQRGYRSIGGYTLVGLFILWKDQEKKKADEITKQAKMFVEKNAAKIIYQHFTSNAKWPEIAIIDNLEMYTDERKYQKDYIEGIRKGYVLWKPFEKYLITGRFKEGSPEDSFDLALDYLRDHLNVGDEEISEKQPCYDCFRFDEEATLYAAISYMFIHVTSLKCRGLLERAFKLGLGLAPMRMVDLLIPLIPGLGDPREFTKYLKALDEVRSAGLSEEIYWAVQLQDLYKSLSLRSIDLEKLKEYSSDPLDKARKHYIRLLKLYTGVVVPKSEIEDPLWLMYEELISIQNALIEGTQFLDNKYRGRYIGSAIKLFGANTCYQNMLDRLAIDKVKKELGKNLNTPVNYYKKYLDMAGVSYREERIALDNMELEYLVKLGTKPLSDGRYLELKELYEGNESGWVHECIVKEGEMLQTLYNLEALRFAAEAKRRGDKSYVSSFFIVFLDKSCPLIHEKAVPKMVEAASSSYTDKNYRKTVMESFEKFLNEGAGFDSIKMLLRSAVNEYGFFGGMGWYNGIQIDEIFPYLSEHVQSQILTILSGVSHEKLKKVLSNENEDRYLDFMIEKDINSEGLFHYLVNNGKRHHLTRLAKVRDCTEYIRSAKVNEIVTALTYIGGAMPKYYPLIAELKGHKSIKVKGIVEKLIEIYRIDIKNPVPYKVVDYGVYRMGRSDNRVEGKKGITREAFEPKCVEETTSVKAEVGMYIGFRFTVKNYELFPEICHHSVLITYPCRNESGEIESTQTRWNQNGFSNSKIFLGWCFEEAEEVISGNYTFEAYDTSGCLIAKKEFSVEV